MVLDHFFPPQSHLFYACPSGMKHGFCKDSPWLSELLSSHLAVCMAGDQSVSLVHFHASARKRTRGFMEQELGIKLINKEGILKLSKRISSDITGEKRDKAIIKDIKRRNIKHLIMPFPFPKKSISHRYTFSTALLKALNSCSSFYKIIPESLRPALYQHYPDGEAFFNDDSVNLSFPCTVKVSVTDFVVDTYLCHNKSGLKKVQKQQKKINSEIFIEEFVPFMHRFSVHFGIPHNEKLPIEILGCLKQKNNTPANLIGGKITRPFFDLPDSLLATLKEEVLAQIRIEGWFGVGSIELLQTEENRYVVVGVSFHATELTPFIFQVKNDLFTDRSLATFTARYKHKTKELREILRRTAVMQDKNQLCNVLAMAEKDGDCAIDAAIVFDQTETLYENAHLLLKLGFESDDLQYLLQLKKTS